MKKLYISSSTKFALWCVNNLIRKVAPFNYYMWLMTLHCFCHHFSDSPSTCAVPDPCAGSTRVPNLLDRLESHANTPNVCGKEHGDVKGSRIPANASVTPGSPTRGMKSCAHDALRLENQTNASGARHPTRTCAVCCERLEKACKHVRYGRNTPKRLRKVELTWYKCWEKRECPGVTCAGGDASRRGSSSRADG